MLEFTLVFPFILLLVCTMVQSMLLMAGNLCVHYAAFCAGRTAVVHIPRSLAGEPTNFVEAGQASPKMTAIKASAVWPLLPISCGADDYPVSVDASSLQSGITEYFSSYSGTPPNWVNQLPTRMSYAMDKTNVTLDPPVSGGLYAEHEDIVAHVDHTFYLSIPYLAKAFGMFGGVEWTGGMVDTTGW